MSQLPSQQELLAALKKSAAVIQKQEKALATYHEPIAIIGMGCRYPGGSDSPEQFWQNLLNGFDAIIELPDARAKDLRRDSVNPLSTTASSLQKERTAATHRGGFLAQVDQFDAAFFELAPREVLVMDPAHRLLLETSWQALEAANIVPAQVFNSEIGVFIGGGKSDYLQVDSLQSRELYNVTGNVASTSAGRLSYVLGLTGPCVAVDTACSSALTAIHLACQSLRNGECTAAIAGGVNLILDEAVTATFMNSNMLADDALCKTFDNAANGYVRGEGCGMVVLKRLSAARADGDTILAIIRGTAINQDGPSGGLTVPNGPAQERVIRHALKDAGLKPEQISYIEAHGTGTPLGDPIEIGALSTVFKQRTAPLYVGSVKTNIGHLEMAAGVAGLMKLVLALQHATIPPHLHLHTPSTRIDWAASPVQVPTTVTPWLPAATAQERIGGVSSFGFSGTNAHVIVAAAPGVATGGQGFDVTSTERDKATERQKERPCHLLTLSAKSEGALQAYVRSYLGLLTAHQEIDLGDLCYTTHVGRSHFAQRLSITGDSVAQLQDKLHAYLQGESAVGLGLGMVAAQQKAAKIAFLFTGQGAQYVGMGRELYETQPTFRAILDRCDQLLCAHLGESLLKVLYPDQGLGQDEQSPIDDTTYTQPALFALEYALATLWQTWGIQPDVLIGHSVGELVAACVAGVISLEEGLKLVAARGRLMGALPQDGEMVSVQAPEARLQAAIAAYYTDTARVSSGREVSIAAVNGPESMVISGKREAVLAIAEQLTAEGIKTRKLTVSHAFHSPLMEPMLAEFRQIAATITYHKPELPLVSNVTGKLAGDEISTPDYWVRHVREAVRFADGVTTLYTQGIDNLLEIGPKPTLLGMTEQMLDKLPKGISATHPIMLPSLRAGRADWQQMLESLGALYVRGVKIDWVGFDSDYARRKVALPTYPFQRQRYWVGTPKPNAHTTLRPLIDKMTRLPRYNETLFETEFNRERLPFLTDHRVYGTVVSPGACQLAIVMSAAELIFGQNQAVQLEDVILPQALVIPESGTRTVQAIFSSTSTSAKGEGVVTPSTFPSALARTGVGLEFTLLSFVAESGPGVQPLTPAIHTTGYATALTQGQLSTVDLAALRQRCEQMVDLAAFYARVAAAQLEFGPAFRWLAEVWQGPDRSAPEALARLVLPDTIQSIDGYGVHPGLLDACFQVVGAARSDDAQPTLLPFAAEAVQRYGAISGQAWWCYARQTDAAKWDIQLLNLQGEVLLAVKGFQLHAADLAAIQGAHLRTDWLYQLEWEHTPLLTAVQADDLACWLVFGQESALTKALVARLGTTTPTIMVTPGATYSLSAVGGQQQATVDPANPATFQQLWAAVAAQHASVGVVYLGHRTEIAPCPVAEQTLTLCTSLLHLVQTLTATTLDAKLCVVTQACQLIGDDQADRALIGERAAAGALWGFVRTVAQEFPSLRCTSIDLADSDPASQAALVHQELLTGRNERQEPLAGQIAYRAGTRYTAHFVPQPKQAAAKAFTLLPDASYLITGGLGALGQQVAQQLIDDGAQFLILSGRQGVTTAAVQATIDQWTASGVMVQVVQADVARLEDVRQLLIACEALAPLRGVVHAAGLLDDGALAQQSAARFAKVMQPKVAGTWHLHCLTAHRDLDFFVCFSSMAALLGSPGQSNYAAANAFMDTLMQQRRAAGLSGSSIQWGPWAEVGLAAQLRDRLQTQGMGMIAPHQGRAIFQALLGQTPVQMGVIPAKISALGMIVASQQHPAQTTVPPVTPKLREQLQTVAVGERRALLERYLRTEIGQVLRLPATTQIGQADHLFQLGFDSLMAVEFKNRVQAALGATLRSTLLFDYPTLGALTTHLIEITDNAQGEPALLPLVKVDRRQPLPLSLAQQRLWFNQTTNRANSYNLVSSFRLEGKLDVSLLEQSLVALLARHEVLHTVFPTVNGTPVQLITEVAPIKLTPIDLQSLTATDQAAAIRGLIQQEVQYIYDLAAGPLFHVVLATLADEENFLLFSFNHILLDAGSLAQIFDELGILYTAFMLGRPSPLPVSALQYADYAAWQRQTLTPAMIENRVAYWQQRLSHAAPLWEPHSDKPRPAKETFQGATFPFQVSIAQTQQLKALQKSYGATLFNTILAVWTALLYRYGQGEELIVGAPFANRTHQELAGVIGHWASMLLLPLRFQGHPTFLELIEQIKQATQEAIANDVPIDQLVQALPPTRKRNNLPHQLLIRFLAGKPTLNLQPAGVTVTHLENKTIMLRSDLAFLVLEENSPDGSWLIGEWEYKLDLFEEASIRRMMEDFHTLLDAVIADPTVGIDTVPLPNLNKVSDRMSIL